MHCLGHRCTQALQPQQKAFSLISIMIIYEVSYYKQCVLSLKRTDAHP